MATRKRRYRSMLFDYGTMSKTDFRDGGLSPIVKTVYKGKNNTCLRIRPPPLKDTNSLADWRIPNVPFNLMHRPKEILQETPWVARKPVQDVLLKEVRVSRPQLVMTPAVSLDEIDDSVRDTLIKEIYTTTAMRMSREAGANSFRAPLSSVYAPPNPITLSLPKLKPPYVSPEWRMESASWDRHQLQAFCRPTKEFWRARSPDCKTYTKTTEVQAERKMRRLSKPQ